MTSISLMKDENLKMKLKPHALSFFHLYVIFALLVVWGIVIWQFFDQEWFKEIPGHGFIEGIAGEVVTAGVIWAAGLVAAGFFSRHFFLESGGQKIFMLYMAVVILGIGGMVAYYYYFATTENATDDTMTFGKSFIPGLTVVFGFLGILSVNWYRRSFTYYLTDARIVLSSEFMMSRDERQVRYNHVEDIKLAQGAVGRIFGFGTVVPITGSGLGTGTEESIMMVGAGKDVGGVSLGMAGGSKRSIKKARYDPHDTLFGVPNPQKVRDYITENIHADTGVEHLKRIEELLGGEKEKPQSAEKSEE